MPYHRGANGMGAAVTRVAVREGAIPVIIARDQEACFLISAQASHIPEPHVYASGGCTHLDRALT